MTEEKQLDAWGNGAHRFGGAWTLIKLDAIKQYLAAYAQALKGKHFRLLYIDAFAGSGSFEFDGDDGPVTYDGSARIALDTTPEFHELIFIEKKARRCQALRALASEYPNRAIRIIHGDANEELLQVCRATDWGATRAVIFLDPYGLTVNWRTLEAIAATRAMDVWYWFPLSAVYRQMTNDPRDIDAAKQAAITRILGTESWRDELYSPVPNMDIFGDERMERHSIERIQSFVQGRLDSIFAKTLKPKTVCLEGSEGRQGARLFDLYFAVSNRSPKAIDPACRIAGHILRTL